MTVHVYTEDHGPLNLRSQPNKASKVLTQIPYRTELEVEQVDDQWSSTVYNGIVGYVMTKFLSMNEAVVTKSDLKKIYDSLKVTLNIIEDILK